MSLAITPAVTAAQHRRLPQLLVTLEDLFDTAFIRTANMELGEISALPLVPI
jgi:hypothetical protein